ncbi:hypothetical protein DOY81_007861, partial [Sarcophaga bullata]
MKTNREKNIYLDKDEDKLKAEGIEKISGVQSKKIETIGIFKHFNKQAKFDSSDENIDYYENCTNSNGDNDVEEEDDERDLTNLNWLTELRNQTIGFVNIALEEEPRTRNETVLTEQPRTLLSVTPNCQYIQGSTLCKTTENTLEHKKQHDALQITQHNSVERRNAMRISHQPKRPSPTERYEIFLNKIRRDLETYHKSATDYQLDAVEKPPFNYSHIIGMAMLDNGRRMTLQQICSWIEKKFAFFRVRKKWNNSIRHNLSLHSCFRKMGRNKDDRGKGGYWELGVDPKKCDRKRIRNRKSLGQTTKKNLQNQYIKTSRRRQQNFQSLNFQSIKKSTFKQLHEIFSNKPGDQLQHTTNNNQGETVSCSRNNNILIKTIEINKNSNINYDEKICVTEMRNRSTSISNNINDTNNTQKKCDLKEFKNSTEFDTIDQDMCLGQISKQFCQQHKQLHNVHQDENKFDTLIISSNANTEMPNIQNLPLEQQET